jgi:hypothetical protein
VAVHFSFEGGGLFLLESGRSDEFGCEAVCVFGDKRHKGR